MIYPYYVAVDGLGRPGPAASKRSIAIRAAARTGAKVFRVEAPNAFLAQRKALQAWLAARGTMAH